MGVVFGYQSNRKFYVVMWRRENINFGQADINAGIKGLQLKVGSYILDIKIVQTNTMTQRKTIPSFNTNIKKEKLAVGYCCYWVRTDIQADKTYQGLQL